MIDVLTQIYNEVPDEVREQDDFKIYVPTHVKKAYALAQAAVANGAGSYFIGEKEMDFLGEKLTAMKHWLPNTIICARVSNLHYGVDLLSDESTLETVDMRKTTLDQVIRVKCRMKSDSNHMLGEEIYMIYPQA